MILRIYRGGGDEVIDPSIYEDDSLGSVNLDDVPWEIFSYNLTGDIVVPSSESGNYGSYGSITGVYYNFLKTRKDFIGKYKKMPFQIIKDSNNYSYKYAKYTGFLRNKSIPINNYRYDVYIPIFELKIKGSIDISAPYIQSSNDLSNISNCVNDIIFINKNGYNEFMAMQGSGTPVITGNLYMRGVSYADNIFKFAVLHL